MFSSMWSLIVRRPARIRVFLVPSATFKFCTFGCDLQKLADRLYECQQVYDFKVLCGPYTSTASRQGMSVVQRHQLRHRRIRRAAPKSRTERNHAVACYFECDDVASQTLSFSKSMLEKTSGGPLREEDLIILISGEVVVPDVYTNEFEGDATLDAYSLLSVNSDLEQKTDLGVDILEENDKIVAVQRVGMISARRITTVFPEVTLTDVPERRKAIVARYLATNIATFVSNKALAVNLSHDDMTGCMNESNWIGGERESYFVEKFCDKCLHEYRRRGVTAVYRRFDTDTVLGAAERMMMLCNKLGEIAYSKEKIGFWVNIVLVSVSLNIIDAVIVDLGLGKEVLFNSKWKEIVESPYLEIKPHWPALTVAVMALVIGVAYIFGHIRRRRSLP